MEGIVATYEFEIYLKSDYNNSILPSEVRTAEFASQTEAEAKAAEILRSPGVEMVGFSLAVERDERGRLAYPKGDRSGRKS